MKPDAVASPARVHARMLRQHAGHQRDQQIGVRQCDAACLLDEGRQFLERGHECARVHLADHQEMRHRGPATVVRSAMSRPTELNASRSAAEPGPASRSSPRQNVVGEIRRTRAHPGRPRRAPARGRRAWRNPDGAAAHTFRGAAMPAAGAQRRHRFAGPIATAHFRRRASARRARDRLPHRHDGALSRAHPARMPSPGDSISPRPSVSITRSGSPFVTRSPSLPPRQQLTGFLRHRERA